MLAPPVRLSLPDGLMLPPPFNDPEYELPPMVKFDGLPPFITLRIDDEGDDDELLLLLLPLVRSDEGVVRGGGVGLLLLLFGSMLGGFISITF